MANISWHDGDLPYSPRFDDLYYSKNDGLAESRYVFLAGNELPARLTDGFCVGELGFGTGLNALALWQAWRMTGRCGKIRMVSFEAYPLTLDEMARALGQWPELAELHAQMLAGFAADASGFDAADFSLHVVKGDARKTLPCWEGRADAWFLDGFAPAKNPELWDADLMREVGSHTSDGGSFATYSAAGLVRRNLEKAGFAVQRRPGFGGKRHMSCGVKG